MAKKPLFTDVIYDVVMSSNIYPTENSLLFQVTQKALKLMKTSKSYNIGGTFLWPTVHVVRDIHVVLYVHFCMFSASRTADLFTN